MVIQIRWQDHSGCRCLKVCKLVFIRQALVVGLCRDMLASTLLE